MLKVAPVPVLSDNYVWLIHDPETREAAALDPSLAEPVLEAATAMGLRLGQVLNTHWHPDHTGGNDGIRQSTGSSVTGPLEAERTSRIDRVVREGDRVTVCGSEATVWEIPGHTAGHIAYLFEEDGMVFVGDTLFAMGCGRLFEGTPEQMFGSLERICSLDGDVCVYCGHEYTLDNARFAAEAEPANGAILDRLERVRTLREQGAITLPTTVAEERATNPFVRAADASEFARLRSWKDSFR